jgi:Family of unknown function (DUF6527)
MIRMPIPWLELLARHGLWTRPTLLAIDIEDPPEYHELRDGFLFREVRGGYPKWAHFSCPRCREHIRVSIARGRKSWRLKVDLLHRPSLSPSIWQTGSCGAHFFIRRGRIDWCGR